MVKQERAARTRSALIRAAARVFADEGFATASLSTISARAGVSNGALHFHFANKSALAAAVQDEAAQRLRALTDAARAAHRGPLQTVVDATHQLMDALAHDVVVRGGFELSGDRSHRDGISLRAQWRQWVEQTLRSAERDGVLARGASWADGARVIVAATAGLEVLGGDDATWLSRHHVTRMWEVILPHLAHHRELERLVSAGSGPHTPSDLQRNTPGT
ncbi:ScbR family autoregulator-binding transcription factor [Streptomyces sp. NPDC048182]|uniref:ScbR family autoregulator-binding transcription factor n=1 Tax=Streptomyces sp. NPDC048182 TaxID=3365507 RepID=UPI003719672F